MVAATSSSKVTFAEAAALSMLQQGVAVVMNLAALQAG
jgi:hypothetical protein